MEDVAVLRHMGFDLTTDLAHPRCSGCSPRFENGCPVHGEGCTRQPGGRYRVTVVREGVRRTTDLDETAALITVRDAVAMGLEVTCERLKEEGS